MLNIASLHCYKCITVLNIIGKMSTVKLIFPHTFFDESRKIAPPSQLSDCASLATLRLRLRRNSLSKRMVRYSTQTLFVDPSAMHGYLLTVYDIFTGQVNIIWFKNHLTDNIVQIAQINKLNEQRKIVFPVPTHR